MPNQRTTVILFRGRPGVGKTTVTNALSKLLHSFILRKDDIYDVSTKYIEENVMRNKLSYGSLYKILESNTDSGATLLLDYPFQINENVVAFQKWCADHEMVLKLVLVTCSDRELWKQRFNKRSESPEPNQLITNFDELEKHYGDLNIESLEGELVIDTANLLEENIETLLAYATSPTF